MTPHRIVFVDRDSLPVPISISGFPHEYRDYPASRPEELAERLAAADIVITNKVPFSRATLEQLPNLKMLAVAATGVNMIDLAACKERGVAVANVRQYGDQAVAEHAFMLMMALMRNLPAYQRDVAAGLWENAPQFCHFGAPVRDLAGATLAIVGAGGIGQALAERARAFGMTVLFAEHKGATSVRDGYTAFDEVLASADVISLHCPLNAATEHLIGEAELVAMKPGAVLINTARGGLIDENALIAALKYGQLGGAGVDVLSEEPPRNGNVLLKSRLPHLIVTPHVAWTSQQAMRALATQVAENIEAFVAGESLRRVV
ncbi:D-2-hydroxyacid dehydrogenase [Crenobacter cavernae]|uniref:D-2-hydroxyacid dehydrogenase n=1 Tax=Crenobacter cavernae TaxID=2290923 RepID=A0A345Y368_9NEIS|nr:D-2-hydroxyacid dehydrogenase [Crenobacter cavernae]AXK38370.1 D-2-hydroxyacid dehydrogenase [Crenobacter cavernae]